METSKKWRHAHNQTIFVRLMALAEESFFIASWRLSLTCHPPGTLLGGKLSRVFYRPFPFIATPNRPSRHLLKASAVTSHFMDSQRPSTLYYIHQQRSKRIRNSQKKKTVFFPERNKKVIIIIIGPGSEQAPKTSRSSLACKQSC